MPRIAIDDDARQEIRSALNGLSGAAARQAADEFATLYDVDRSRIYDITKDVRPPRKRRSDKGKRIVDPLSHEGAKFVLEQMVTAKLRPDLAIETARANGFEVPFSHGTLLRYARELGINRRQIRNPVLTYRSFEAKAPLERFQFDITGLKMRWWADVRTRRILKVSPAEVSINHPNENRNRVQLWCFQMLDDYSRFRFVRFVACPKPNSTHVVDFLWAGFREMGIPLVLYTDNDPIICSRLTRNAISILDRYFADSGGFKHETHQPGNPRATGKVEVAHQIVAEFWNLIGVKVNTPDLATLNVFAARVSKRKNFEINRSTGIMPVIRFREGSQAMRVPPDEILNSAFKSRSLSLNVTGRLTFSVDGVQYQLPTGPQIKHRGQVMPNPFLALAGQKGGSFKINVVWPRDAEHYVAIATDGSQFEFDRLVATADAAGEYKTAAESVGQKTRKVLESSSRDRRRAHKEAGTDIVAPGIDQDFAIAGMSQGLAESQGQEGGLAPAASLQIFPRQKQPVDPALLAAVTEPGVVPPSMIHGRSIDYWSAVRLLIDEEAFVNERGEAIAAGDQVSAADMAWLKSVFNGRDEIPETELRERLSERSQLTEVESKTA